MVRLVCTVNDGMTHHKQWNNHLALRCIVLLTRYNVQLISVLVIESTDSVRYTIQSIFKSTPYITINHKYNTIMVSHSSNDVLLDTSPDSCVIGWIGFGLMGTACAQKHMEHKYRVLGYNRTMSKVHECAGVEPIDSIEELVKKADIVFSSLTDDTAVNSIYQSIIPVAKRNQIFVEMSTCSPHTASDIAKQLSDKHCYMLDAPISGSPASIAKGAASIIAGGDQHIFDLVKPLLACIGPGSQLLMGDHGKGQVMKLAINLHLAQQVAASCESVLICESYGITRESALTALLSSAAASAHMKYRAPYINKLPDKALFTTKMMAKDLRLVQELAGAKSLPLPVTSIVQSLINATGKQYSQQDFAAMYKSFYSIYLPDASAK